MNYRFRKFVRLAGMLVGAPLVAACVTRLWGTVLRRCGGLAVLPGGASSADIRGIAEVQIAAPQTQ